MRSLNQTLPAGVLALALLTGAPDARAWPPPDGDSVGIGGAITVTTLIDRPLRGLTVGFGAGAYAPVYSHEDGRFSSRVWGAATVTQPIYLYDLAMGNVSAAFAPVDLRVGLHVDADFPPSPGTSEPTFNWSNSAELVLDSQQLQPAFEVQSRLNLDLGLGGSRWLEFTLPLLAYRYNTLDGTYNRLLGLSFNLFSNDATCGTQGCLYDSAYWSYSITTVPEPAGTWLLAIGLAGLGAWRARHTAAGRLSGLS